MKDKDSKSIEHIYLLSVLSEGKYWSKKTKEYYKQIVNDFVQNNIDLFQYHNLDYILNDSRSINALLLIKDLPKSIMIFLSELNNYQSNHYGNYDDNILYNLYFNLPDVIKKRSQPKKEELNQIYRGDSQRYSKHILSFAIGQYAKDNAKYWGENVFPLSDLKTYQGILDLTKFRNALEKTYGIKKARALTDFFEFGDDENEVLVFGGEWKQPYKDL